MEMVSLNKSLKSVDAAGHFLPPDLWSSWTVLRVSSAKWDGGCIHTNRSETGFSK
jgi:hypothetical protein